MSSGPAVVPDAPRRHADGGGPGATTSFPAAIARAIAAEGTRHAFGLMGAGTIQVAHHLTDDEGVSYHAARHEAAAVGAADGYSRASGEVGVAMVTWGPAVTNTLTALTTARRGASPVVLVAGDTSTSPASRRPFAAGTQAVDPSRMFAAIDVPVVRCTPESVAEDVAQAFAHARLRETPVALLVPVEYLQTRVPVTATGISTGFSQRDQAPVDRGQIERAVELLRASERPVILAGRGALLSGAREALVDLAERTGALLSTSVRGVGLFDGHPYNTAIAGGLTPPGVAELLARADCVVSFGASLNAFTMKSGRLFPAANVIHCDLNASAFHAHQPADAIICGDTRAVATALLDRLGPGDAPRAYRALADDAGLGPAMLRFDFPDVSREGALDPREVCRRLDAVLPAERTIVTDCGQFSEYPVETMTFQPGGLLWMLDFGAVGSGLGAAIGAALGRPSRTTALFIGDGGFLMTMGELDLAIRDRVPLLVVCMNDRAYGSELYHMRDLGLPDEHALFETPDFAAVARAMGADAERITRLEQLDELGDRLRTLDAPLFLDCMLTQELLPTPLRGQTNIK